MKAASAPDGLVGAFSQTALGGSGGARAPWPLPKPALPLAARSGGHAAN